jgi:hypothetical protein
MTALLPVAVLAATQITVRLIGVAAMIWQERIRAQSHCAQMRTASAHGVVLLERRRDGAGLAIFPQDRVNLGGDATTGPDWEEAPVS